MARGDSIEILSSQQEVFLSEYLNPKSDTFGNAYRSALKAGFTESYAQNITAEKPQWLQDNIGRRDLLAKAEKVFHKTLNMKTDVEGHEDASLLRIQNDTAKFVGETVGKAIYSKKSDIEINMPMIGATINIVAPVQKVIEANGTVEPLIE